MRDAVALLDQLATYGAGSIADEDAARLLGGFDLDLFHRLLAAITKGDGDAVATLAAGIEEEGWDPRQLYGRFLGYCRDALHLALGRETATPAAAALRLPPSPRASTCRRMRSSACRRWRRRPVTRTCCACSTS